MLAKGIGFVTRFKKIYDFVIVGGGIVGLSAARSLKLTNPALKMLLLEKAPEIGTG